MEWLTILQLSKEKRTTLRTMICNHQKSFFMVEKSIKNSGIRKCQTMKKRKPMAWFTLQPWKKKGHACNEYLHPHIHILDSEITIRHCSADSIPSSKIKEEYRIHHRTGFTRWADFSEDCRLVNSGRLWVEGETNRIWQPMQPIWILQ